MVDIEKHAQVTPSDPAPVIRLAERMVKMETQIHFLENALASEKAELRRIETEEMPALMQTLGFKRMELTDGWTLEVKPFFEASLPSFSSIESAKDPEEQMDLDERRNAGFKWLRGHKASDLIKNILRMDLGKGNDAAAKKLAALAKSLKIPFEQSESVHAGSLKKFLRETLEAGRDIPFDTFAVFSGEMATVKPPKVVKPK